MDRYWISREQHGLNKVSIPSMDDLEKYADKDKSYRYKGALRGDSFEEKAEVCAEIIKLQHPNYTEKETVKAASALMRNGLRFLLEMREKIRQDPRTYI